MKSSKRGTNTLKNAEVEGVLKDGVWLLVKGHEHFLPFTEYPWLKKASMLALQNVKLLHGHHLYWPELDIDLELESLEHPEQYPLIYR